MPRPGDVVRSLAFYLAFYGGTVALVLAAVVTLWLGSDQQFRSVVTSWNRYHRVCVERILKIRIVIEGRCLDGPALIAMKHEAFFEAIDLPVLLPHPVIFAKVELMRLPLWGYAARRYGLVEVARDEGAKALRHMLVQARELTAGGRPLAIFPEGTRVPHGTRPRLQSGFSGLYKLLGLPVVAVAVNSGPLYHRWWKRSGTITIRFAEPIPPGLPREEIEARVHVAINALNPPAQA